MSPNDGPGSSDYQPRFYRDAMVSSDLASFHVVQAETDLFVSAPSDLSVIAQVAVAACRAEIEGFLAAQPLFATTLQPLAVPESASAIIRAMAAAGQAAGVGPMAAVAGATAEYVGRELLKHTDQVIVENGGDIFIVTTQPRVIAVYAGASPLSDKFALAVRPESTPLGICTSSGTVGHSKSFGNADAAVVLSPDTALADAWATAIGNLVHSVDDVEKAVYAAQNAPGVTGALVIKDDKMAAWGDIEIEPLM